MCLFGNVLADSHKSLEDQREINCSEKEKKTVFNICNKSIERFCVSGLWCRCESGGNVWVKMKVCDNFDTGLSIMLHNNFDTGLSSMFHHQNQISMPSLQQL